MNLEITKRFTFEAAHHLPWHQGKCHRPHGHSYILEVTAWGPINVNQGESDYGMVLDFSQISEAIKPIIDQLDHHDLNEIVDYPTAENLVVWIVGQIWFAGIFPGRIRLYETPTSWVDWYDTEPRRIGE